MEDADWELYNIKTDPCEVDNLSKKQPELVVELRKEYDTWAKKVGVREKTAGKTE